MPEGKFFFIRSNFNGLVLDIQGANMSAGTPIITWAENGGHHQMWFLDPAQHVIRSRKDENFVLEAQGDALVINGYNPDEINQKWYCSGDRINCLEDPERCFDIKGGDIAPGAEVCTWSYNGGDNQHWTLDYQEAVAFFVWNQKKNDKVLDVKGDDQSEGAKVILYDKKSDNFQNQLFYEDRNGYIRSFMNTFSFDTYHEGKLRLRGHDPDIPSQRWVKSGEKIVHRDEPAKCLEAKSGGIFGDDSVREGEYTGDSGQKWTFEYLA